jgi:hypothetical protein
VEPEKEALFNETYRNECAPPVLQVPGVVPRARFKKQEVTLIIGGERETIRVENEATYNALYEIDSPEVLVRHTWIKTTEAGRWSGQVCPLTRNRRLVVYRKLAS